MVRFLHIFAVHAYVCFLILCECVNWRVYSNKTIIRIAVICARNRNLTKGSLIYLCSALSFAPISSKFIHISFSTYFIMVYVHVKAQTANTRVGHIHFNIKTLHHIRLSHNQNDIFYTFRSSLMRLISCFSFLFKSPLTTIKFSLFCATLFHILFI